jgi:hypothetical protein
MANKTRDWGAEVKDCQDAGELYDLGLQMATEITRMPHGIPSKDDLELHVVMRDDYGNEMPLSVLEFERDVDFTRDKIVIRVIVRSPAVSL